MRQSYARGGVPESFFSKLFSAFSSKTSSPGRKSGLTKGYVQPVGINSISRYLTDKGSLILAVLLALMLFFAPLFPDIKLSRPKLLVLEAGLYSILFLWMLFSFYRSQIEIKLPSLFLPAIIYVAATSVFYLMSQDRPVALSELKRSILSITALFVASNVISSENRRSLVFGSMLAGSFLAILYGILQHFGGIFQISVPKMDRIMSTFGNPIFFAAHLVIFIPIAAGIFLSSEKLRIRLSLFIYITCALIALYLTKTRAAYIGFSFSAVVFSLLLIKSLKNKLVFISLALIIFASFAVATRSIWSRQQAHSLIWRDTLVMWQHNPVFGTGPGTFHIYFPSFASEQLKSIWPQSKSIVNDAHNEYVQYLSETGVVGFGILLWVLMAYFRNAYMISRKTSQHDRYIVAGLIASSAGILAQNFFSVDMRFIISAVYLFLVMGMVNSYVEESWIKKDFSMQARAAGMACVLVLAFFSFQKVLEPYIAQRRVASTPDFFDQKILEPVRTISELVELGKKFPKEPSIFEKLGWIFAKDKNWPEAIKNYEKANLINPRLAGPLNNLGNIYYLLGNMQKADEYWNHSLAIDANQLDSRLNLATAYYCQGRLKEASEELKKVLTIDPGNDKAIVMLKQMIE